MFSELERTIKTVVEGFARLDYIVSSLEKEVGMLNANLQRVGEDVNEQDIRIAVLEALMKGHAKTPESNTLLKREAAWPPWDSVLQKHSGADLPLSAAPPKAPPPTKAPPQITWPMDQGHETVAPKEPPLRKAPPQMTRPVDHGACPITGRVKPHKAPPEQVKTTPLAHPSAFDLWDPIMPPPMTRTMEHGHETGPPKEPPPRKAAPQMTRPMDHGHETGLPKEPPPKKAPPQIPRPLDPGACPITSQVRPHKAPPEYLRTTPQVISSAPLRLDMARQGDRSQASHSWDPLFMPTLSHEPSKPDGQLGE